MATVGLDGKRALMATNEPLAIEVEWHLRPSSVATNGSYGDPIGLRPRLKWGLRPSSAATSGSYGDPDRIEAASERCGDYNGPYGDPDQIKVRASVGASAAREERAGRRPERRRLRLHAPPPEIAHAQPRTL